MTLAVTFARVGGILPGAKRLCRNKGNQQGSAPWQVLPSHVDVRTQAMYQMLDPGFVGLIISAFNEVRLKQFWHLSKPSLLSNALAWARRRIPASRALQWIIAPLALRQPHLVCQNSAILHLRGCPRAPVLHPRTRQC